MLLGWLVASGQTWVVLEPLQIVLVAALPLLISEEGCMMRTFEHVRYIYNESAVSGRKRRRLASPHTQCTPFPRLLGTELSFWALGRSPCS